MRVSIIAKSKRSCYFLIPFLIFFLVGSDQAVELDTWYRIGTLATLCTLVPMTRPGFHLADIDRLSPRLAADVVARLKAAALEIPPMDVSSTDIRRRVREGKSLSGLVPPAVETYIREKGLYR